MPHDIFKDLLPAASGSAISLLWLRGNWRRVLAMLLAGAVFSYYVGAGLAEWMGVHVQATQIVMGVFSMAVVDRIFHGIERFDFHALMVRIVDKFLGARK